MWKKYSWCLVLIFFAILSTQLISGIRINEVMPHSNSSLGDEWIELYNENNYNLSLIDWKIGDKVSNDTINLNISANSFAIITDSSIGCSSFNVSNRSCIELTNIGSGLNDVEEVIYLYNNSVLIDNFSWSISIKSSGNSWQFYNGSWQKCGPTPGQENLCQSQCISDWTCGEWSECKNGKRTRNCQDVNNCSNTAGKPDETKNCSVGKKIHLELRYSEKVKNGEYFEVEFEAFNLEDKKYDIKVFIQDGEEIISETYHKASNVWKSSVYYVSEIIEGSENKTGKIKLRIKKEYEDFKGEAKIMAKIREYGDPTIIDEIKEEIEILERVKDDVNNEGGNEGVELGGGRRGRRREGN